jgi:hypothetical protein
MVERLQSLAPLLGSVTTITLAALGAWWAWHRKPRLSLALDPDIERHGGTQIAVAGKECAFARLVVSNRRGTRSAFEVSVTIENVVAESAESRAFTGLVGMQLAWADREPTNPRAERATETIGPGASRRIDLAHLNASVHSKMIVDVRPQPTDQRNYLADVDLTIQLAVGARDVDPKRYQIDIIHHGTRWRGWSEDPRRHMEVGHLRPVKRG